MASMAFLGGGGGLGACHHQGDDHQAAAMHSTATNTHVCYRSPPTWRQPMTPGTTPSTPWSAQLPEAAAVCAFKKGGGGDDGDEVLNE